MNDTTTQLEFQCVFFVLQYKCGRFTMDIDLLLHHKGINNHCNYITKALITRYMLKPSSVKHVTAHIMLKYNRMFLFIKLYKRFQSVFTVSEPSLNFRAIKIIQIN